MDTLNALLDGFGNAVTLANLGWAFLGVTLGTAIGILPGIGPALTIALLLPLTAHLDPTGAFIMFAGLYYGAMYGSSTTSILLNTPGESGSIITAIEGHLMARQGRGAAALATAAILFVCVAYGFGSRRYVRDGVSAIVLAVVVYVGFTRGLDLQLPAGVLAGIL